MAKLTLSVLTPEKIFFEGEVENVIVKTIEGDVGILSDHVDYLSAIAAGPLKIKCEGKDFIEATVSGGFISVVNNQINILTDTCEQS